MRPFSSKACICRAPISSKLCSQKKTTCEKKRATLPCKPENFVNTFDSPAKDVVSVLKLRDGPSDAYSFSTPVFTLAVCLAGNSFGFLQGRPAVPYRVPNASSTWTAPTVVAFSAFAASATTPAPALPDAKYTNLFGEPVNFSSTTFLQQENNLIVYVSASGTSTNRYFFSFG